MPQNINNVLFFFRSFGAERQQLGSARQGSKNKQSAAERSRASSHKGSRCQLWTGSARLLCEEEVRDTFDWAQTPQRSRPRATVARLHASGTRQTHQSRARGAPGKQGGGVQALNLRFGRAVGDCSGRRSEKRTTTSPTRPDFEDPEVWIEIKVLCHVTLRAASRMSDSQRIR